MTTVTYTGSLQVAGEPLTTGEIQSLLTHFFDEASIKERIKVMRKILAAALCSNGASGWQTDYRRRMFQLFNFTNALFKRLHSLLWNPALRAEDIAEAIGVYFNCFTPEQRFWDMFYAVECALHSRVAEEEWEPLMRSSAVRDVTHVLGLLAHLEYWHKQYQSKKKVF